MKFADKIRQLRQEQHLTQAQVAEAAGITRRNYISYEKDGRYPRNRQIYYRLADLFGCDVNYLLTEDELFIDRASEEYGSRGRRQAEILVKQLSGLFAGGELSDHDRDAVMIALQKAYFDCKEDNLKFTPKKYLTSSDDDTSEKK